MTSNRPTSEPPLDLIRTEAPRASSQPELPTEESVSAAVGQPAWSLNSDNLMDRIVDQANFETAWQHVRANHGAPGPDRITVDEFPELFRPLWPDLRRQLLEGTYQPGPARRKSTLKPDGGQRNLGIPNVIDRLVQQAPLCALRGRLPRVYQDGGGGPPGLRFD